MYISINPILIYKVFCGSSGTPTPTDFDSTFLPLKRNFRANDFREGNEICCPAEIKSNNQFYRRRDAMAVVPYNKKNGSGKRARLLRTDKIIGRHFVMKCSRFFYIKSDTFGLKVS